MKKTTIQTSLIDREVEMKTDLLGPDFNPGKAAHIRSVFIREGSPCYTLQSSTGRLVEAWAHAFLVTKRKSKK